MKILIYGAGVQGSYLAHVLVRGGNDVTILARGKRFDKLKKDGIVIRHYLQRKTTVDKVNVISKLLPDDIYDIIFVLMQYQQSKSILSVLSDNISKYIVFVGNNSNAREFQDFITKNSNEQKQIAFGFQTNGGRYENSRIVNIRLGGSMDIGSLDGKLSWHQLLENAFNNTKYKLIFNKDMDSWLKTHMIFVMALAYVTYACNGNLRKINKNLTDQMVKALNEGYAVLETLGYKIIPATIANLFKGGRNKFLMYVFLKIYALTPFPKLSDPTKGSFPDETIALTKGFNDLKKKANIPTPNWDTLEKSYLPLKKSNE